MPAFNELRYNLKCEISLDEKGAETKFNSLSNEKPSVEASEGKYEGKQSSHVIQVSLPNGLISHKNCFSPINH